MKRLLPALLGLSLLATPALADPITPGMAADIDANLWPEARLMDEYLFDSIILGDQMLFFEGNPLSNVAEAVGGTMSGNYEHRWLCYDAGGMRVHLLGDWRDHDEESTLDLVTVEKAEGADDQCDGRPLAADPTASGSENAIPAIGATADELVQRFGSAEIGLDGRLAYRAVSIHGDEESWTVTKTVYYRLVDGMVDQVAYGRESRDNPYLAGWGVDNYRLRDPGAVDQEPTEMITGPFKVGEVVVDFQSATLGDIASAFGGEIREEGEAGAHMLWLCYLSDTPTGRLRTWFISDGEMGGPEHRLSTVAVDPEDAEDEWSHGCIDAPASFAIPTFGFPTIGAKLTEVDARFGTATPDARGNLYYASGELAGDGTPMAAYQSLSYRTAGGVVTGFSIDREIAD